MDGVETRASVKSARFALIPHVTVRTAQIVRVGVPGVGQRFVIGAESESRPIGRTAEGPTGTIREPRLYSRRPTPP